MKGRIENDVIWFGKDQDLENQVAQPVKNPWGSPKQLIDGSRTARPHVLPRTLWKRKK